MASEVDSGIIEVGCDYESIRSDQALLSWFPFTEEYVATSFQKIPDFSWEESESDSFIPEMEFPLTAVKKNARVLCPLPAAGDVVGQNTPFSDKVFWLADDSNRSFVKMLCILCPCAIPLIYSDPEAGDGLPTNFEV
ncbi:hypothetical protein OROHE_022500 [Orobanche hederae]